MSRLYRENPKTGQPYLTNESVALMLDVPLAELEAHVKVHGTDPAKLPEEWVRAGQRRAREAAAATGEYSMKTALDYFEKETDQ